ARTRGRAGLPPGPFCLPDRQFFRTRADAGLLITRLIAYRADRVSMLTLFPAVFYSNPLYLCSGGGCPPYQPKPPGAGAAGSGYTLSFAETPAPLPKGSQPVARYQMKRSALFLAGYLAVTLAASFTHQGLIGSGSGSAIT